MTNRARIVAVLQDGPLIQKDIAEMLNLHPSAVSTEVRKLVAAGVVTNERADDPLADHRVRVVALVEVS